MATAFGINAPNNRYLLFWIKKGPIRQEACDANKLESTERERVWLCTETALQVVKLKMYRMFASLPRPESFNSAQLSPGRFGSALLSLLRLRLVCVFGCDFVWATHYVQSNVNFDWFSCMVQECHTVNKRASNMLCVCGKCHSIQWHFYSIECT